MLSWLVPKHLIKMVLVLMARRHTHFFKYRDSYAESAAVISESLISNKHRGSQVVRKV